MTPVLGSNSMRLRAVIIQDKLSHIKMSAANLAKQNLLRIVAPVKNAKSMVNVRTNSLCNICTF